METGCGFYEDDEPTQAVIADFESGPHGTTADPHSRGRTAHLGMAPPAGRTWVDGLLELRSSVPARSPRNLALTV